MEQNEKKEQKKKQEEQENQYQNCTHPNKSYAAEKDHKQNHKKASAQDERT